MNYPHLFARASFTPALAGCRAGINRWTLAAALLCAAAVPLPAVDLFRVDATTDAPSAPFAAHESTNNVITLLRDIGGQRGALQGFNNTLFSGSINYADVPAAIHFEFGATLDALGRPVTRFATFTFRDQRAPVTFTGATNADLEDQVIRYFRRGGTSALADFNSPISLSDGNPNAVTATAASTTFNAFGTTGINRFGATATDVSFFNPLDAEITDFQSGSYRGYRITAPLGITYHIPHWLDDRVSIKLDGMFSYISIRSADIYQGGGFLGVPIEIIKRQPLRAGAGTGGKDAKDAKSSATATLQGYSRLAWTVTPNGGAVGFGSEQFAQGGIIYLGGLTSALSYDFTDRLTVTLGDAFTVAEGGSLDIDEYHFNNDTDQVVLKNGLSASYRLSNDFALEGQALATDFVNRAAVPVYASAALQGVFSEPLGKAGLVARLDSSVIRRRVFIPTAAGSALG